MPIGQIQEQKARLNTHAVNKVAIRIVNPAGWIESKTLVAKNDLRAVIDPKKGKKASLTGGR